MSADSLNYHHLLYFWTVAKEGSITAACEKLHLAQPTISGQLKKLETRVGGKLYQRVGRHLVLTKLGETVFRYADEIFSIGEELIDTLNDRPTGRATRFHVGVPEVLPKLVVFRLLQPVLQMEEPIQLICHEGAQERLLNQLANHELDVVLSDSPASSMVRIRAFNHPLGQSGIGLFGTQKLIEHYAHSFPESFENAPVLMPANGTALRRSFEQWLLSVELKVNIVGEFDDTALMKVFAEAHTGFVAAPLAVENEIRDQFSLHRVCEVPNAREEFYAITLERRLRHPAILAMSEAARTSLFRNGSEGEELPTEVQPD